MIPKTHKINKVSPRIVSINYLQKLFSSWHRKKGLEKKPVVCQGGRQGERSAEILKLFKCYTDRIPKTCDP